MAKPPDPLLACTRFDWDNGNAENGRELHRVTPEQAEDMFFHEPLVVRGDVRHSTKEKRFYALRQTGRGRLLSSAFTIRKAMIRIISVRDMNQREREVYERHQNTNCAKTIPEFRSELTASAGLDDRRSEDPRQQTGPSLPISSEGVSR
jgi:uncharacterized DUF497 family protein